MVPDRPGVRRERPEKVHLTMRFVGPHRSPADLVAACQAAAERAEPGRLALDQCRAFPTAHRPSVYAATGRADASLIRTVSTLNHALLAHGVPPGRERFRPHVTLARITGSPRLTSLPVRAAFRVDRLALVAAQPDAGRTRYVNHRWFLLRG